MRIILPSVSTRNLQGDNNGDAQPKPKSVREYVNLLMMVSLVMAVAILAILCPDSPPHPDGLVFTVAEGVVPHFYQNRELVEESQAKEIETVAKEVEKDSLIIAGLGDILFLNSLAQECYRTNFSHLWEDVSHLWKKKADHVIANFEGVTGPVNKNGELDTSQEAKSKFNREIYTSGVSAGGFNYHESLVADLTTSGIDVLTTANNHAFDRGFQGITTTAELLQNHGFIQVGSSLTPKEPNDLAWVNITSKNGWKVAWIGCTNLLCATCRRSLRTTDAAVAKRVLFCKHVPGTISRLLENRKEGTAPDFDVIVVAAHWGVQFKDEPPRNVQTLAIKILEAGATVVFGNHPHVMQNSFRHVTKDGRITYCIYSLGSLTSGLGSFDVKKFKQRTSAVVLVKLVRRDHQRNEVNASAQMTKYSNLAEVAAVEYHPICEIWTDFAEHKKSGNKMKALRKMVATSLTRKCYREASWAKRLLGVNETI